MSKRNAIIIIVLTLILGTGVLYFILGGKAGNIIAPIFDGSPFGTPPGDTNQTPGGEEGGEAPDGSGSEGGELPRFLKLSDAPVSGYTSIIKNGLTYVRFVDRATGHVFDINPSTLVKVRLINTTIPRVYESLFKADGSGFVARTIPDGGDVVINSAISLIAPVSTSTEASFTTQATPIRGELGDIALLPNGNLIYAAKDTETIVTSTFTGGSLRTLLNLPFSAWRFYPISNASVLLVTKASEFAQGYAYTLNTSNGALRKVLGPLNGLSAVPSSAGERIAFSHTGGGGTFSVLNTTNSSILNILPLTLAEKCVWSKKVSSVLLCGAPVDGLGAGFPDRWYEGTTSYSDRVWRFNTNTDTAEIILDPEESFEESVDVINPSISQDEDFFFFINKGDLSLWALRLEAF